LPDIYKKIKSNKPDYLYQGIPSWESFVLGLICYWLNIKYILRISNDYLLDDRLYAKSSKAHAFFLKLGIKLSYCVLCQNEYQYNIIKKQYPNKLALKIHNPIYGYNLKGQLNTWQKSYIAWLGLFQYQKNIPLLYDIACALKNENILIAGKEESICDSKTFEALMKLRGLPNVKFIGFLERKEVLPFLAKAKFLLNTSHYEGFSNTFLEAMSVGTPIITSTNVNPDNIIENHKLGIVYKNVLDLQINYASLSQETYTQMNRNVIHYVENNHDYKILSNRLFTFLKTAN
jgi:glycosyltransferase involved in cell wall biosynthesis